MHCARFCNILTYETFMKVGDLVSYKLNDNKRHVGIIVKEHDSRQKSFDVLMSSGKVSRVWIKYLQLLNRN